MTEANEAGTPRKGPVLIELEEGPEASPDRADPVPDLRPLARPAAMERMAVLAARKPSALARWFWRLFAALFAFVVSVVSYQAIAALIAANPILGAVALVLTGAFVLVLLAIAVKELSAFARLKRIDTLHRAAETAANSGDLKAAQNVADRFSCGKTMLRPMEIPPASRAPRLPASITPGPPPVTMILSLWPLLRAVMIRANSRASS